VPELSHPQLRARFDRSIVAAARCLKTSNRKKGPERDRKPAWVEGSRRLKFR
jgi:hypothetical protein